jgi:putative flippase GtrA
MNTPFARFLLVGFTTVGVDLVVYLILVATGLHHPVAKGISFATGTVFAYFANRSYTFRSHVSGWAFVRFCCVYVITFLLNVGVNQLMLELMDWAGVIYLAFVIATGISAVLNFLGMRFFVFTDVASERTRHT